MFHVKSIIVNTLLQFLMQYAYKYKTPRLFTHSHRTTQTHVTENGGAFSDIR